MNQLAVFVTLKSKPGKRDALWRLWRERAQGRAAENQLETIYVYAFDMRDATIVSIVEVFESMDAFHQTSHAKWFKDYMKEVTNLLDGKPTYYMAVPQWIKAAEHGASAALSRDSQSIIARLINLLPASGPIKKAQEYLASPVAISVSLRTKPGKRDAVKAIWEAQVRQRAEENPLETNYIYAFDMRDDTVIRLAEVVESMDAFHQLARAKWFKSYLKEVTQLLDGKPEYTLAVPQWVK